MNQMTLVLAVVGVMDKVGFYKEDVSWCETCDACS